jgi:hypothetical protein
MRSSIAVAAIQFAFPQFCLAQTSISVPMPLSRECIKHVPFLFAGKATPEPSTLKMNNDGGWCWFDNTSLPHNTATFTAELRVTRKPVHGQIVVGPSAVPNKTRVSYKPDKGYVGMDSFTVINMTTNNERQVDVTIVP